MSENTGISTPGGIQMGTLDDQEDRNDESQDRSFRDYFVPGLLFALTLVFGVLAIIAFPFRPAVRSPGTIQVSVDANAEVRYVSLVVTPPAQGTESYTLTSEVALAEPTPSAPSHWTASLHLVLPGAMKVEGCGGSCSASSFSGGNLPQPVAGGGISVANTFVSMTLNGRENGAAGTQYWYGRKTLRLDTHRFAFDQNGEDFLGQLPSLTSSGDQDSVDPATADFDLSVLYRVPNASSYIWTGGPEPSSIGGNEVSWDEQSSSSLQPIQISGTNKGQQDSDTIWTFIAGGALAIAGGALIGGVTELLHVHPQTIRIGKRKTSSLTSREASRQDDGEVDEA
jgi:hypothetical protein